MTKKIALAAALIAGGLGVFGGSLVHAQMFQRPPSGRFRIVSEDAILTPEGAIVPGTKVWTVSDSTGGCLVIVFTPGGLAMTSGAACR